MTTQNLSTWQQICALGLQKVKTILISYGAKFADRANYFYLCSMLWTLIKSGAQLVANTVKTRASKVKQYLVGQQIGLNGLKFVRDLPKHNAKRIADIECTCGSIFSTRLDGVINSTKKHCGNKVAHR